MKYCVSTLVLFLGVAVNVLAQQPDDVVAAAGGHTIKVRDLSERTRKLMTELPTNIVKTRASLLEQFIDLRLLQAEAAARGMTSSQVIIAARSKVKDPTEAQIKAVYDQNRAQIGDQTLEQVRDRIIDYLRYEPEQQALGGLINELRTKFRFLQGKNAANGTAAPSDVIFAIDGKPVTAKEFDVFAAYPLYRLRAAAADAVLSEVNESLGMQLAADEARSLGMDTGALIAREVTNRMKDFTEDERTSLQEAFHAKLFEKYGATFAYKRPEPLIEAVSADDDPASGPATAPVRIVMFGDFQCSACSLAHPMLKVAMAAYPGKILFVVRDFPLETIHDHSFRAALAAYASAQQGKFFEYTEILYKNQAALDDASLSRYAASIGLNVKQFELDLNSEKAAAEVRKDIAEGENMGVNSTPTIFINGVRARALSVSEFRALIDKALKK